MADPKWTTNAGHDLYLHGDAADRVGNSFTELATTLAAIQKKFENPDAHLGMDGSSEGKSWDHKVSNARRAVYNELEGLIGDAKSLAAQAHQFQDDCKTIDEAGANKLNNLPRSAGYPA